MIYLKIEKFFDYVVVSQETQLEKVSYQPFQLLVSRLKKASYDHIWLIGDNEQDFPRDIFNTSTKFFLSPYSKAQVGEAKKIYDYATLQKMIS